MDVSIKNTWLKKNQEQLLLSLNKLRPLLKNHIKNSSSIEGFTNENSDNSESGNDKNHEVKDFFPFEFLSQSFGLTDFEKDILLMCAGVELDAGFAQLVEKAQKAAGYSGITFGFMLTIHPKAHWSALSPSSPLRLWQLIKIPNPQEVTKSHLRIEEHVLHYLTGIFYLDEQLQGLVHPLQTSDILPKSHSDLVSEIFKKISNKDIDPPTFVIQLYGEDNSGKRQIANSVSSKLKFKSHWVNLLSIPSNRYELENFIRIWEREAILSQSSLVIEVDDNNLFPIAKSLINRINTLIFISCAEPLPDLNIPNLPFKVSYPTTLEQKWVWNQSLKNNAISLNGEIDNITSQFQLSTQDIQQALQSVKTLDSNNSPEQISKTLWQQCRMCTRKNLENLAQHIDPKANWEDLVLPSHQKEILKEISLHVRHRSKVYYDWGFANKDGRGLGISALFTGPSGTGKTMAAEVLANELNLDLYRIDLSQAVSKFVGETEKNLKKIFDAAEQGGAILLFDEADALFGKRSDVKDSHDRFANIQVSYLLQRMEAYNGLAILTTNLKKALDEAFLRRLRFIIQFPFPDQKLRKEIWQKVFPKKTPLENLNIQKLSRLNVSGGNIRNIALYSAFLAVESKQDVSMRHLMDAAKREYLKLEKPINETEFI